MLPLENRFLKTNLEPVLILTLLQITTFAFIHLVTEQQKSPVHNHSLSINEVKTFAPFHTLKTYTDVMLNFRNNKDG